MILSFLNKPFPRTLSSKRNITTNFFIGCFVAFFLIVFQPFNISEWQTNHKIAKLLGFGLVSFLVPFVFNSLTEFIFSKKTLEDDWKVWHEILIILALLFFIAFGNLGYSYFLRITTISLISFFNTLIATILLGIFPISLHVILKHNSLLRKNNTEASLVNSKLSDFANEMLQDNPPKIKNGEAEIPIVQKIILTAENEKDKIELLGEQLLYIESVDNYCSIVYTENGKIKKQLLRSSLKRLESQLVHEHILRCHRTFVVNLENVKNVEGNAAGYKLNFFDSIYSVPVSRNFGPLILERLKKK